VLIKSEIRDGVRHGAFAVMKGGPQKKN